MSRITISHVSIEGFRNILNFNYDFDSPGLNIIRGINGVGKSTIFEAIVWAIYGETMKKTNQDKIPTWPEKRDDNWQGTKVSVFFTIGEDDFYQVIRHIGYEGTSFKRKGGDSLLLIHDEDGELELVTNFKSKPELQKHINSIIGMSCEVFINSIVFGQRMKKLVQLENSDKRSLFEEIFSGMDFIEDMKVNCKNYIAQEESRYNDLNNKIHSLDIKIISVRGMIVTKNSVLNDFNLSQQKDLNAQIIMKVNIENKINNLKEQIESVNAVEPQSQEEINKLTQVYMSTKKDLDEAVNAGVLLTNNHRQLLQIIDFQTNLLSKYQIAQDNIDNEYKKALDKYNENMNIAQARIDKIKKDKETALLSIPKDCDSCGQPLPEESVNLFIQNKTKEWDERIEFVKQSLIDAEKNVPVKGQISYTKKDVDDAESLIRDSQSKVMAVKEELEKSASDINQLRILTNEAFTSYSSALEEVKAYEKVANVIKNYRDEIIKLEATLKAVQDYISDIINRVPPNVDTAEDEVVVNEYTEALNTLTQEMEACSKNLEPFYWWVRTGLVVSGLPAFMFKTMLAKLNFLTEQYGRRLGVSVRMSVDLSKASKPFTTTCSIGASIDKEYEELSGGQKQRIDIVLMWALHDVVTENNFVNILVMDEAIENLDAAGKEAVMELVRFKADKGHSIYMISHDAEGDFLNARILTAEYVDNQFTLA